MITSPPHVAPMLNVAEAIQNSEAFAPCLIFQSEYTFNQVVKDGRQLRHTAFVYKDGSYLLGGNTPQLSPDASSPTRPTLLFSFGKRLVKAIARRVIATGQASKQTARAIPSAHAPYVPPPQPAAEGPSIVAAMLAQAGNDWNDCLSLPISEAQELSLQVWKALRQILGLNTFDVDSWHPYYFLELYSQRRGYDTFFAFLNAEKPALLIIPEESPYFGPTFVDAAHRFGIKCVIVPFTLASAQELEIGHLTAASNQFNTGILSVLTKAFSKWTIETRGRTVAVYSPYIFICEIFAAYDNPWRFYNGRSDAIAAESPFMVDHYQRWQIAPERIKLTGALTDDALFVGLQDRERRRADLLHTCGVKDTGKIVLIAVPPDMFGGVQPGWEFTTYETLCRFMVETAVRLCGGQHTVLINLHPRVSPSSVPWIKDLGAHVIGQPIEELVPVCDIFIAVASATIRYAISCGIPTVNYDAYLRDWEDYKTVESVCHVTTKQEYIAVLGQLIQDNLFYNSKQKSNPQSMQTLDGRSKDRMLDLFRSLAKTTVIPGSRTTICIPTLNRSAFVRRALEYYASVEFPGVVLVGDGSSGADLDSVRADCKFYQSKLRIRLIEDPHASLPELFATLATAVDTDFVACSGDDDLFVMEGIASCEALLNAERELVSAHGRAVAVHMNGPHGIPIGSEQYPLPTITQRSALGRVEAFFENYAVSVFNLHRIEAWRRMWAPSANMRDKALGAEISPGAISAALGRTGETGELYLIRQSNLLNYPLPQGQHWILTQAFTQSAGLMLDALTDIVWGAQPSSKTRWEFNAGIWAAFMRYLSAGYRPTQLPRSSRHLRAELRQTKLESLLDSGSHLGRQFQPALRALTNEEMFGGIKPKLLISWGNPYTLGDIIEPLLEPLSVHFSIVLLIVDYRLTPEILATTREWKQRKLVIDTIVAPNHGGTFRAHLFMAEVLPMLRAADFDVLLTISAMQPFERYILEYGLSEKCVRVVLWPHTTFISLNHPELAQAVRQGLSRAKIDAIVRRLRAIEPSIWREMFRVAPGKIAILTWFLLASWRSCTSQNPGAAKLSFGLQGARNTHSTQWKTARPHVRLTVKEKLLLIPIVRQLWAIVKARWPNVTALIYSIMDRQKNIKLYSSSINHVGAVYLQPWPMFRSANLSLLEQFHPHLCDRYIYPNILVGGQFPLHKYDYLTQLGTDQFDACLFFSVTDAAEHRALFNNPNIHAVRYPKKSEALAGQKINAVLMPFSLHSREDLSTSLVDLYARDLKIAVKESGADEIHIRPHPGRVEPWLAELAEAIRARGVSAKVVSADQPVTDAAARYKGVIGPVSASLRDVRLACDHVFVVGSMALSKPFVSDPKAVIGLSNGIGWIEADGSYDPHIFQAPTQQEAPLPGVVETILQITKIARPTISVVDPTISTSPGLRHERQRGAQLN